jgi:hypothetical protein
VADRAVGSSAASLGPESLVGDAITSVCGITSFETKSRRPWAPACAARSKTVLYERVDRGISPGQGDYRSERARLPVKMRFLSEKPSERRATKASSPI